MRIHVKQCLATSNRAARFDAGVGDVVLLSNGNRTYVEATICSVKSNNIVVVSMLEDSQEPEREISASEIQAVVLSG